MALCARSIDCCAWDDRATIPFLQQWTYNDLGHAAFSMKNQPIHVRVGYAAYGFMAALRSESSFRLHVLAALAVIFLLIVTRPSPGWWVVMIITATVVMTAELLNTAIEHLADHLHPERHPQIRIVKDCAAAAVLVASTGALGVAAVFIYDVLLKRAG